MATIYDLVTPKAQSARWEENYKTRKPYMGEAFFPERKQLGTELSYLQGKSPKVRPLNLSSYDAKVISIGREGFKTITTEIPFFKNDMKINEKQRQQLNNVLQSNNDALINPILNAIFDDQSTLLNNADVTREMMRMQLLTTGTIAFANNGQAIQYDFGVTNKPTTNWNDASTADPIADISKWADDVEEATGERPAIVLMNKVTLAKAAKAQSILDIFAKTVERPTTERVRKYMSDETQLRILTYDKGYNDEEGNFSKFVPDNTVVIFPEGAIGEGVFGTTPEESDLMTGATDAQVSIVDMGVAITATKETDPVTVKTKVSMSYLPVLNRPETIVIASVNG